MAEYQAHQFIDDAMAALAKYAGVDQDAYTRNPDEWKSYGLKFPRFYFRLRGGNGVEQRMGNGPLFRYPDTVEFKIWGPDHFECGRMLRNLMRALREEIGREHYDPNRIAWMWDDDEASVAKEGRLIRGTFVFFLDLAQDYETDSTEEFSAKVSAITRSLKVNGNPEEC